MEVILFIFIGMFLGVYILGWLLNQSIKDLQGNEKEQIVDRALKIWKDHMIPLTIEKVNERFYAYNDTTGEFVCQGADFDELQANFQIRFPDNGSYIREKDMHHFPEELKKAQALQKKAHDKVGRVIANLDDKDMDIVIIDDREQNKE